MDIFEQITPEYRRNIREPFSVTDEQEEAIVKRIKDWVNTQPDLPPEAQDENFISIMLLRRKFVEKRTKEKIQDYFRTIADYPETFSNLGNYTPSNNPWKVVLGTKITPNFERIVLIKYGERQPNFCEMDKIIVDAASLAMVSFHKDYIHGSIFIIDVKEINFAVLGKVTPSLLLMMQRIHEDVLAHRVISINIINAPGIFSKILALAKTIVKPKLLSKVTIHNDLQSLHNAVSPEFLPTDFGGQLESLEEMQKKCDQIIEGHRELFAQIAKLSPERPNTQDGIFGVQGSFKQIYLD